MILISASSASAVSTGDPIFNGLRFEVRAWERIGLLAPTARARPPDVAARGGISPTTAVVVRPAIRVSLLRSHPTSRRSDVDVRRRLGFASLLDLQREMEEAAQELAKPTTRSDPRPCVRRYDELHDRLRASRRLLGRPPGRGDPRRARLPPVRLRPPADVFRRPAVAAHAREALAGKPRRDAARRAVEPSRHRDDEVARRIICARQSVAMVVVSHDRYFLDRVVTKIWELHQGEDRRRTRQLHAVLAAPTEERQGARTRQAERQAEQIARP